MRTSLLSRRLTLALAAAAAAPLAACTDAAPRTYAIDAVTLPRSNGDLARMDRDLDGDGMPDDALGLLYTVLCQYAPSVDVSARASAWMGRQDPAWTIAIDGALPGAGAAGADAAGAAGPIITIDRAPISALVDPLGTFAPVVWAPVVASAADLRDDGAGGVTGTLALAIEASPRDLVAPLVAWLDTDPALVARTGLDRDGDGVVTADEALASPWVRALFVPDLTIDGHAAISLSIHVHAHAVP